MTNDTRKWIRNASDHAAVKAGCRFDPSRGEFVVEWIQKFCRLYEGENAGQAMDLRDWQLECTMRLFGWVVHSKRWGREIRRFKTAGVWIAKKNKKSPTLAAWGLYLLAGDGEQGQKVFLAAKDGQQARDIAGKHAVEMLHASPALSAECELNQSTLQITHMPTRSLMKPLSSANKRTQESKEGINGSVLIDETHVVDREFIARLARAGISRSEPLQIEVSTAGNNPDGYGFERFQRAQKVESGEFEDQELFAAVYAAPQDLSDADLDADPVKYGRMANPAFGHTVDEEEFLGDYRRSKPELRQLLDFRMYRCNIWQMAASPWLRSDDWTACREDFSEETLAGQECVAGLDLSKTRDMTALVLVFRGEGSIDECVYRLLPYFWMPAETARQKNHLAPFLAWAKLGYLELTPGNVVDYGFIRARFRKLAKQFTIRRLAYDQTYAEETTQALEQGVVDAAGNEIEEGTGVERVIFPQKLMSFTGPCKEFERLVIAHRIRHNGHPLMSWQAGHVQVKSDANGNIRPVKPPLNDHKKIDGIVAAVEGFSEVGVLESSGATTITFI